MLFDVILHLKKVSSTMDIARGIIYPLSPPFIVVSEEQDNGYGQMGRKWFSPYGGLWFTEAIQFPGTKPLSLFISVIVVHALEKYAKNVQVKWPNDIYLNGKKLGGILTIIANKTAFIGIGINVGDKIPEEIKNFSISLKSHTALDKNILLKNILVEQEKYWETFVDKGFSPFMNFYNTHLIFSNKKVVIKSKRIIEGIAFGVNASGALLIKTRIGVKTIFSGTVLKF